MSEYGKEELRQIQKELINEKREIENRRIEINEELDENYNKIRKLERIRIKFEIN